MLCYAQLCLTLQVHGLWPARLLCLWNFPGEYWRGLPFPIPDDISTPGTKPRSLASPALEGGLFTTSVN